MYRRHRVNYIGYPCVEQCVTGSDWETRYNYQYFVIPFSVELIEKLLNAGYYDIAKQANYYSKEIGE